METTIKVHCTIYLDNCQCLISEVCCKPEIGDYFPIVSTSAGNLKRMKVKSITHMYDGRFKGAWLELELA